MATSGKIDYQSYIKSGIWKCSESPSGAHFWVGQGEGYRENGQELFRCKHCGECRLMPAPAHHIGMEDPNLNKLLQGLGKRPPLQTVNS